jgi:hypothetical protein
VELDEWLWRGRSFAVDCLSAGSLDEALEQQGFSLMTRH